MLQNVSIIEIIFKVKAQIKHGEEIRISGNVPALGCNDVERALPLYTTPNDFPWWSMNEGIYLIKLKCL
jgi:hypothetical protein